MSKKAVLQWTLPAAAALVMLGCHGEAKVDAAAAAPPKAEIVTEPDLDTVRVDNAARFALVTATGKRERTEIHATGAITPDVERSVPVVSLAAGRVTSLNAKLGDDVKQGQVLLKVLSNDIANAYQTYGQALADEALARRQLERARLLYDRGAISLNDLQVAEDAEQKASIARDTTAQQIRTLGADPDHQETIVSVRAPVSGTIVEQNVAPAGAVRTPDNQQSLFTIADLSRVWAVCDIYENDLPAVQLGDNADVRLNAYPDRVFRGRIANIGKVLDPSIRTAKVRIELTNPGIMRAGMFVTATFFGKDGQTQTVVPSTAILHLHDRDWIFVPDGNRQFRRRAVDVGKLQDGMQVVRSGLNPGEQVVKDALALSAETGQ